MTSVNDIRGSLAGTATADKHSQLVVRDDNRPYSARIAHGAVANTMFG